MNGFTSRGASAIDEWSLFFSFSLWGGYGLVGQPRAPPRERKQREKTNGMKSMKEESNSQVAQLKLRKKVNSINLWNEMEKLS